MRRAPHDTPVANQQRLGRLVTHAQSRGDSIRYGAVGLHRHHRVLRVGRPLVEVCHELVQRLHACAARMAVLEEEQRSSLRLANEAFEFVNALEGRQIRMHLLFSVTVAPNSAAVFVPVFGVILRPAAFE